MNSQQPSQERAGAVVIGTTIMLLGVALMLERADIISEFHYSMFWGLLILAIGIVKLSVRPTKGRPEGGWWVFFGVLLLLNETRAWRFHDSWPLIVVAVGISMVWKEVMGMRRRAHERLE